MIIAVSFYLVFLRSNKCSVMFKTVNVKCAVMFDLL